MPRIVGVINCNHVFFHSVDYDAPLSEAGDITEKFQALKEVIEKYNPDADKQGDKTVSDRIKKEKTCFACFTNVSESLGEQGMLWEDEPTGSCVSVFVEVISPGDS